MKMKWILAILTCLLGIQESSAELKLIQVIHRHGNRAPTSETRSYYLLDPYRNYTYYPEGWGGLTNTGKVVVYNFGKYLRQKYGSFLGTVYTRDIAYFRADEIERIVETGQLVAAALFPPNKLQKWNTNIPWQPIPIWLEKIDQDILYNSIQCTNFQAMRDKAEATDPCLVRRNKELKGVYDELSFHAGSPMNHWTSFLLRQSLFAQMDLGLKLPEWTKEYFPNKILDEIAVEDLNIQSWTPEMKQLNGGMWVKEWLKHVDNHMNSTSPDPRKGYFYAAHEMNIAAVLIALEVFDKRIPEYSSALIFELHKEGDIWYVKVLYRNEDVVNTLEIPGCRGINCELNLFKKLVSPLITENERQLCGGIDVSL